MVFSSERSSLKYGYSKDKDNVYYKNKRIKNSVPNTFVTLDYRYAKDSNQAYYLSHSGDPNRYKDKLLGELHGMLFPKYTLNIIEKADLNTFKSLPYDSGNAIWALDKINVYWCGQLFENADAASFEIINGPGLFAKDKLQFYDSSGYWPTVLEELPKIKTPSMYPDEK
jgi:hypothetical protein